MPRTSFYTGRSHQHVCLNAINSQTKCAVQVNTNLQVQGQAAYVFWITKQRPAYLSRSINHRHSWTCIPDHYLINSLLLRIWFSLRTFGYQKFYRALYLSLFAVLFFSLALFLYYTMLNLFQSLFYCSPAWIRFPVF